MSLRCNPKHMRSLRSQPPLHSHSHSTSYQPGRSKSLLQYCWPSGLISFSQNKGYHKTGRRISRKQWRQLNKENVWCECGLSSVRRTFIPDIFLHQCCQHPVMRQKSTRDMKNIRENFTPHTQKHMQTHTQTHTDSHTKHNINVSQQFSNNSPPQSTPKCSLHHSFKPLVHRNPGQSGQKRPFYHSFPP